MVFAKREDPEKMDITPSMMVQPLVLPGEMIEMQIKQEIARRGSLTPQEEYSMSELSTVFPQAVPTFQSDVQKSQMIMDHYQANLVATAQLSLQCTQDVIMTQDQIRSPENIMNTNIAPTIMVPAVHGGLETVIPILSTPDTNPLLATSLPSSSSVSPMDQDPTRPTSISIHDRTSPVAVKNMILNAAAEILSSPEQSSAETRSTINALIALNSELSGPKIDTPTNPTASHRGLASVSDTSNTLIGSQLLDKEIR